MCERVYRHLYLILIYQAIQPPHHPILTPAHSTAWRLPVNHTPLSSTANTSRADEAYLTASRALYSSSGWNRLEKSSRFSPAHRIQRCACCTRSHVVHVNSPATALESLLTGACRESQITPTQQYFSHSHCSLQALLLCFLGRFSVSHLSVAL